MVTATDVGITVFSHELFGQIRLVDQSGEPWFVARDVCDSLGTRTDDIRAILDPDEVADINPDSIGVAQSGGRNPLIISESGLYAMILRSRKPEAKEFQRWVRKEVLPQIRKTGSYQSAESFEQLSARVLSMAQERIDKMESQIQEDAPKVEFYDCVTGSDTVCQLAVAAQVASLPFGRNTLFRVLREQGVLISSGKRHNLPTQEYVNRGYFTVVENRYTDPDTEKTYITFTTQCTQRGIDWLIRRFGKGHSGQNEQVI